MFDNGISVGEKVGKWAFGAFCCDYTLRIFVYFIYPKIELIEVKQQAQTIASEIRFVMLTEAKYYIIFKFFYFWIEIAIF